MLAASPQEAFAQQACLRATDLPPLGRARVNEPIRYEFVLSIDGEEISPAKITSHSLIATLGGARVGTGVPGPGGGIRGFLTTEAPGILKLTFQITLLTNAKPVDVTYYYGVLGPDPDNVLVGCADVQFSTTFSRWRPEDEDGNLRFKVSFDIRTNAPNVTLVVRIRPFIHFLVRDSLVASLLDQPPVLDGAIVQRDAISTGLDGSEIKAFRADLEYDELDRKVLLAAEKRARQGLAAVNAVSEAQVITISDVHARLNLLVDIEVTAHATDRRKADVSVGDGIVDVRDGTAQVNVVLRPVRQ